MSWIYYLLEANLYLAVFYVLYYFIFRDETYYLLNRIYLLASTIMAFAIPVMQVGILSPPTLHVRGLVVATTNSPATNYTPIQVVADTSWPLINYLLLAYGVIVVVLLVNFLIKIYRLIKMAHINKISIQDGVRLIELRDNHDAFSFFNYLFISPGLTLSSTVINHELIHIKQKHSWDIIYLELLKIINWFNPAIYLLQNSMKEVHEFIADSQTVDSESNAVAYTDFLISNAYGIKENTLTNTFFNKSLLKKRIMMLHQKRSGKTARLKYLLVLPMVAILLCASTLAFAKDYGWIDLAPAFHSPENSLNSSINSLNQIKRLKVTFGNRSSINNKISFKGKGSKPFILDKISFKEGGNKLRTYTVNSLTEADKLYLLKNHNAKVEVVDYVAKPNTGTLNDMAVSEMEFPLVTKDTVKKIQPPPPPVPPVGVDAPKVKTKSLPPPPPPAKPKSPTTPTVKHNISINTASSAPTTFWANLGKHMEQNVHYPTEARTNDISGDVITQFTVDNDQKITNIKIISGLGHRCDEEVIRVLKSFNGRVDIGAGDYVFATSYLINIHGKDQNVAKTIPKELHSKNNFLGEITVITYIE